MKMKRRNSNWAENLIIMLSTVRSTYEWWLRLNWTCHKLLYCWPKTKSCQFWNSFRQLVARSLCISIPDEYTSLSPIQFKPWRNLAYRFRQLKARSTYTRCKINSLQHFTAPEVNAHFFEMNTFNSKTTKT